MNQATHDKIVSFIWGIADDVLHDPFKRGKYQAIVAFSGEHEYGGAKTLGSVPTRSLIEQTCRGYALAGLVR